MQSSPQPHTSSNKWLAMLGLGLGVFLATLSTSIVNLSLPTLTREFNTNFATIQWVILSFSLVLTALLLSVARLGDMRDKKQIYLAGLIFFTLSSLLCGLAPGVGWLIGLRALQGLGAAMMQALGMAMITEIFPLKERGRAIGVMGSVVSLGVALGPPLGGALIGLAGWRSIFFINLPVGIVTALVVWRFVPSSPPGRSGQRFDLAGALTLLITLGSYALGMTYIQTQGFRSPMALSLLVLAAVGLTLLIFIESRVKQPMIALKLFLNPLFGINLLMGMLVFVVLSASIILPFILELVWGYPAPQAGLILMSMPLAMGVIAPAAGLLADRFGTYLISILGLLVLIGGCLWMGTMRPDTSLVGFLLRLVVLGVGVGLFQSPNNSAIMGAAPRMHLGMASGLLSLSRALGQSSGLSLMGAVFTASVLMTASGSSRADIIAAPSAALVVGVNVTYRFGAALIAAGLGATLLGLVNARSRLGFPRKSHPD
ncbi:MAG: MFS transporter [Anaerolineaceae bacterium]|nr:MFS transporter [Anaerolineaceae bacterium]